MDHFKDLFMNERYDVISGSYLIHPTSRHKNLMAQIWSGQLSLLPKNTTMRYRIESWIEISRNFSLLGTLTTQLSHRYLENK